MTDDSKTRLLIADDDMVIRAALVMQLGQEFEIVGQAVDTDEAIEMVKEHRPDLAVVDVQMPAGGGLRATQEIRALSPETTIVALSADESDAMVRAMIQAGAIAYVRKGMKGDELIRILRQSLSAHAAG